MTQVRDHIIDVPDGRDSQSIRDSQNSRDPQSIRDSRDSLSRTTHNSANEDDDMNYRSRWERTSFIGILHLTHIIPFFRLVRAKTKKNQPVTIDDIPRLGRTERVEAYDEKLYNNYHDQKKTRPNKQPSVVRAIIKTFKKEVIWQFIFQTTFFGLRLVYGFFLHELLMTLQDETKSVGQGFKSAIGLFVSLIVSMYASQQAYFNNYNLVTKVKAALISLIYKKINKVSLYSLNQLSMGKIINIVANDINTFDKFFNIFALCLMPIVFGGGIAILCHFYGAIALTGFAFIFLTFPLQMKLAKSSSPARKEKNRLTDERVKFTNEIIESIRLLKMYAWELAFKSRVEDIRKREIEILKRLAYTEGAQRVLAFSAISGSSFIIFLSYTLNGGVLNVGLVFSTVFLMQVVAMYGVFIPAIGIAFLVEAKLTFKRIQQIFDLPEIKTFKHKPPADLDNAVEFRHFSGFWDVDPKEQIKNQLAMKARASKSIEEAKEVLKQVRMASAQSIDLQDKPHRDIVEEKAAFDDEKSGKVSLIKQQTQHLEKAVLKDVNLDIKSRSLTAIIGKVGSGKSTLLLSLTGEMPRLEGSIRFSGKIAYVEQEPIIFSGTIRDNITFGMEYEPDFYSQVVRVSCLLGDFKQFPLKDLTEIGEKGITLSGGQKARVALARALYSRADIYLLDDPLSAVDTKVAKRLYEDAIRKFLRDKTVLLATHQVHFVRDAEKIVIMDDGQIMASGTYEELQQAGFPLEAMVEEIKETLPTLQLVHKASEIVELEEVVHHADDRQDEGNLIAEEEGAKLFADEDVHSGKVSVKTYKHYFKLGLTKYRGTLLLVLLIGTEILNIAYGRIIGLWGQGELERNVALGVAGGLAVTTYLFFFSKIVLYTQATLRGSRRLHDNMLNVIIRNTVEFFDTNPVGRVLNRFSHDVGVMDRMLPQYLLDILEGNTYLIALFLAVWAFNPWVIISGVATIIAFVAVIRYTTKTVVVSRQLELVSRSPLYSFFSMTLSGLIAVRSFGQTENFTKKFTGMVNVFTKSTFAFWHSSRFMSMLIDYTSSTGALIGLCIIIGTKDSKDPDTIGQSALYLLLLNEQIQWILRQTINVNLFMASAARIIDYTENTTVEDDLEKSHDGACLVSNWPQQGAINFDHIYMKYRKNTEHVVRDLTFKVKPGEKIGCVGRTGAGKSSILQILFRMVEIDRTVGNVSSKLEIDNENTANLGLHTLRKSLSIIPQTPVLFTGTIRRNLDPFGARSDQELWDALHEVNLKENVEKLEGKLDTDLTNASQTFSVGQKQLICLARAILKKTKIIVLDEATANVDFETDNFIQTKIMEKFKDCTVFTIAHRLSTIANYDKVLVMDKGRLAEFDTPYKLLVERVGDNGITKKDGIFASMVNNTGSIASRHIFEVAREKYESQDQEVVASDIL